MNDRTNPNPIRNHSYPVIFVPIFITFSKVAPTIVGIAKKNENSVGSTLFKPCNTPPIIVTADHEVPGTIARHWNKPIPITLEIGISLTLEISPPFLLPDSIHISTIP